MLAVASVARLHVGGLGLAVLLLAEARTGSLADGGLAVALLSVGVAVARVGQGRLVDGSGLRRCPRSWSRMRAARRSCWPRLGAVLAPAVLLFGAHCAGDHGCHPVVVGARRGRAQPAAGVRPRHGVAERCVRGRSAARGRGGGAAGPRRQSRCWSRWGAREAWASSWSRPPRRARRRPLREDDCGRWLTCSWPSAGWG